MILFIGEIVPCKKKFWAIRQQPLTVERLETRDVPATLGTTIVASPALAEPSPGISQPQNADGSLTALGTAATVVPSMSTGMTVNQTNQSMSQGNVFDPFLAPISRVVDPDLQQRLLNQPLIQGYTPTFADNGGSGLYAAEMEHQEKTVPMFPTDTKWEVSLQNAMERDE